MLFIKLFTISNNQIRKYESKYSRFLGPITTVLTSLVKNIQKIQNSWCENSEFVVSEMVSGSSEHDACIKNVNSILICHENLKIFGILSIYELLTSHHMFGRISNLKFRNVHEFLNDNIKKIREKSKLRSGNS